MEIKSIFLNFLDLSGRDLRRHVLSHHQNEPHFASAIEQDTRSVRKPPTKKRGDDQTLNHEYKCMFDRL